MQAAKNNPMYLYLVVLSIASMVGLQAWLTLFNNFAVEMAGLDGHHVGMIQSVREVPGFLTFLVIFVIMVIREHRLSAFSILCLGAGFAATGFLPSYHGLLITTLVMSFGFHYFETTQKSLTLQYFGEETSPWVFGKIRSMAAASSIAVGILIFVIKPFLNFTQMYLLIGGLIIAAGIWGFRQKPIRKEGVPQRKKMIVRKKYWLFYFLTFMAGARRQIFMAFAIFLLVKKFDYTVQEVTALFVLTNMVNYLVSPIVGQGIIRFGERKILSLEYFCLIFIFIAYVTIESRLLVGSLFILDHVFFNCSIAINTYFQKVGDPRDVALSMAVGFAINHIAAVVLPAIGGLLWIVDYRIPFFSGAAMSLVSLLAVQQIRTEQPGGKGGRH
jgi:hypothetical protein